MKKLLLLIIFLGFYSCTSGPSEKIVDFAIVIHGGAGNITPENLTPERQAQYRSKLDSVVRLGQTLLSEGSDAITVVERVINEMENSPLFNSGKGAVLTEDGRCELDASIMDGASLNAGGVAGIHHIKNPISLARLVMEKSPHVLLFGEGAELFARTEGMEWVDENYFKTRRRLEQYQKFLEKKLSTTQNDFHKYGTVGAVVLDKHGNIAAGTSTGGTAWKKYGRVGDSPLIGSGTYADNQTCGVSCTGQGEYFIRLNVAKAIADQMQYGGKSLSLAAKDVIHNQLEKLGGEGGIIALDHHGMIVMEFNTAGMFRALALENQTPVVKMFGPVK